MSSYIITQTDIDIAKQKNKVLYSKIELLNSDFKPIELIQGVVISDSFSENADSDIRRTYSLELFVKDSSFLIGSNRIVWMDKYIRPYIGIQHQRTGEIIYYCQGTYTMLDMNYQYDESTRKLSITCSDLMSNINGDRNGLLHGALTYQISAGEDVRGVLVDLLEECGISKYIVDGFDGKTIPYDLEFNVGDSYYSVLKKLIDLFSYYEMFCDVDGVLHIQKYPHSEKDEATLTSSFFNPLVISESINTSFKDIYNQVEVWGKSLSCDYSTTNNGCSYSNNVYSATISGINSLTNFAKYAIYIPSTNSTNCKLNINGYGAKYITNDNGSNISASSLPTGYVVVQYRSSQNNFYYLGQYQVYAKSVETNTDSPYHSSKIGTISKVCNGGEYEKIYSDSLAQDRADVELYLVCRRNETINLSMIYVPWLRTNWLIEYTPKTTNKSGYYMIKQISGDSMSGAMNVTLVSFYDGDPFS